VSVEFEEKISEAVDGFSVLSHLGEAEHEVAL
jgi:hypothetical protein